MYKEQVHAELQDPTANQPITQLQQHSQRNTIYNPTLTPTFRMQIQAVITAIVMATATSAAAVKPRDGTCHFRVGFARGQVTN